MPVFSTSFILRNSLGVAAVLAISACGSLDSTSNRIASVVTPFKVEVVQGNFVSKEQIDVLRPGMTRAQVREVLGTPFITSAFHQDRWDYVFTFRRKGIEAQNRKLVVFFKGDVLDKFDGDTMPTEAEFVATLDNGRSLGKVPLLEVPEEVLKEFGIKNANAAAKSPALDSTGIAPAAASASSYPPLEASGVTTSAWDAGTQRAVAASAAARPTAALQAPIVAAAPAKPVTAPVQTAVPSAAPAPAASTPAAPAVVPSAANQAPVTVSAAPPAAPAAPAKAAPVAQVAAAPAPAPALVGPSAAQAAVPAQTPAGASSVAAPAVRQAVAPAAAPAPPMAPVAAPIVAQTNGFAGVEPELSAFLSLWMNDWQARNASAFFAHYAPEFKGTSNSRAEWEALRRPRIESRLGIAIGIFDVRTRVVSPSEARVVFRQSYESDAGSEIGTKAMFLVKRDGRWLIEREFFTPAQ